MRDDIDEQVMRAKMVKIEKNIAELSDELIIYTINVCADELDKRDWERRVYGTTEKKHIRKKIFRKIKKA